MAYRAVLRRCARDDRGSSILEFALVLPMLVMLLLGSVTGGLALTTSIAMADAVREGARFGATAAVNSSWGTDVHARTVVLSATELATTEVCVRLEDRRTNPSTTIQSSPSCSVAEPATPTSLTGCVVKVWARKAVQINIGVTVFPRDVTRASYARYERPC